MPDSDSAKLQLILLGTNHKYAPIDFRERLFVNSEDLPARLKSLVHDGVLEAVVLSTCNRTEVYATASANIFRHLIEAASNWSHTPTNDLKDRMYLMYDNDAVRHLIRVASGLDSMVVGEDQIQGQIRDAARTAIRVGTSGRFLSGLFRYAIRVSRKVRDECGLSSNGESVSSAAMDFLRKALRPRQIQSILLIGAGKMITLAASDPSTTTKCQVWFANRTVTRAQELAARFGGNPVGFNEIPEILPQVDAVLSCTSARTYLITRDTLEDVMKRRATRNHLVIIDASVPRNIDPNVSDLPNVKLFNIDDLQPFVKGANELSKAQLEKAGEMIREASDRFLAEIRSNDARDTLKGLRRIAENIRQQELSRALNKIGRTSDREKEILDLLTQRIINKLLYEPTARLKAHMGSGDGEAYEAMVRELFGIGREKLD